MIWKTSKFIFFWFWTTTALPLHSAPNKHRQRNTTISKEPTTQQRSSILGQDVFLPRLPLLYSCMHFKLNIKEISILSLIYSLLLAFKCYLSIINTPKQSEMKCIFLLPFQLPNKPYDAPLRQRHVLQLHYIGSEKVNRLPWVHLKCPFCALFLRHFSKM